MQRVLLFLFLSIAGSTASLAQVTKLASNKSIDIEVPLGKGKAILWDGVTDGKLWVTDGTPAGTFILSDTLMYENMGGLLGDKYIFAAKSPNLGSELWITDGTVAGTKLVKDIVAGKPGSEPTDDFAPLGGYLYFTASVPGIGRELWRTNGTEAGTTMVKEIVAGPAGSGTKDTYNISSTGSFVLFSAITTGEGYELWRSDGTDGGTTMVKDIYPGSTSSQPSAFQTFNGVTYFWATTQNEGRELWRTDGTDAGTKLIKDIRPGTQSSINAPIPYQNLSFLYPLNGKLLFTANDGTHGEEIWFTDGTEAGTDMLIDLNPEPIPSFAAGIYSGVQMNGKLYFTAYQMGSGAELWETDGTKAGTKLFFEVMPGPDNGTPVLMPNFQLNFGSAFPVHQGNMFYFLFAHPVDGVELWKSDGTVAGTTKVKVLKTIDNDLPHLSWMYTKAGLYFSSDDGLIGDEIWKSDGTEAGTTLVINLNPNEGEGSEVSFYPFPINGKYLFTGTDGDNAMMYDLYALDGNLAPLPVKLESVTVSSAGADGQLKWQTASEQNTLEFVVERSDDGKTFSRIGAVAAAGHSSDKKTYLFADAGIGNSGRQILYYRLRMRDRDGKETISKVVSLTLKGGAELSVQLLGNPVRGDIKLSVSKTASPVNLTVKDAAGRTVKALQVKNENNVISVPAGDLLPGAYFLVAECHGKSSILKFLKQ
jgi:ELWxxDGT repeat protein